MTRKIELYFDFPSPYSYLATTQLPGADAVLIHSKCKTPDEILSFCKAWPGHAPLVLVPTSYPQLSFAEVSELGKVGLIICGNHAIQAAVAAMRRAFAQILADGSIAGVEQEIASVSEIFALQGDALMRDLERAYLRSVCCLRRAHEDESSQNH